MMTSDFVRDSAERALEGPDMSMKPISLLHRTNSGGSRTALALPR